jgi:RNA polymerase sigma-70 factor, ECF subfamily
MSTTTPESVTRLLNAWQLGDECAADRLIPMIYAELRSLAGRHMRVERADHTLQPTALVNEAFLRLAGQRGTEWRSRAHFLAIGSQMMRRILVDHSRKERAAKRNGGVQVTLGEGVAVTEARPLDLVMVDEALERLAELDPRQAKVVELRFFGGLDNRETAAALGVSLATVKRDWTLAKAWLQREIER